MTKYTCYIRRDDRLKPQVTITITDEELDRLIDGGSIQGYTHEDIEMIALKTDELQDS